MRDIRDCTKVKDLFTVALNMAALMKSVSSHRQTRLQVRFEWPQQENWGTVEFCRVPMMEQNILSSSWYYYLILFQTLPHAGTSLNVIQSISIKATSVYLFYISTYPGQLIATWLGSKMTDKACCHLEINGFIEMLNQNITLMCLSDVVWLMYANRF